MSSKIPPDIITPGSAPPPSPTPPTVSSQEPATYMQPPPTPPPRPARPVGSRRRRVAAVFVLLVFLALLGAAIYGFMYMIDKKSSETAKKPLAVAPPPPSYKPPQIELSFFATGFPTPTDIVSTNDQKDDRMFVLDRSGLIRIVKTDGTIIPVPFLDISSLVLNDGEMGLLGMAFSPNYATDGFFFINYVDKTQTTNIARYKVSADPNKADPASLQTVLTIKQPYPNHKAGDLVFGADGYLYVPVGDGGSKGDPENHAQNKLDLLGKILRLDVRTIPYKIPPTNPYATQNKRQAPEVWASGLRNPWRISFDSKTNELYIADVGQDDREEINIEAPGDKGGHNYGWRCYEGTKEFKTDGCGPLGDYLFPAIEYDHTEKRCSITGGFVYRGQQYPALAGKYFYADYCSGQIYWTEKKQGKWNQNLVTTSPYTISTFGLDSQGELYFADFKSGSLYKLRDLAN